MINTETHKNLVTEILRKVYADPVLATSLGFKGGAAAALFYDLPRSSVSIDFDLLIENNKDAVFEKMQALLPEFVTIEQMEDKMFVLVFSVSYPGGPKKMKIEISKRPTTVKYEQKNYRGISLLVMGRADMVACKLAALLKRQKSISRDVYDIWYFLNKNWEINEETVKSFTGRTLASVFVEVQKIVPEVKKTDLLDGLSGLINAKQREWVKARLVEETVFFLRLYQSRLTKVQEKISKGMSLKKTTESS